MKQVYLFFVFFISFHLSATDFPKVREIANRQVPWLSNHLVFKKSNTKETTDQFTLQYKNRKIHITANSENAAAMGLGWYLKNYCHRSMSHLGDNLSPVSELPKINKKITIKSSFKYRYALNYCTVSYSMANYKWEDWERELDWLALNGVNLVLAPVGMEIVWQNTLMQLGYTQQESLEFIAHPTFSAWWLMGNLENWGGNVSQMVIEQQKELQLKILKRMKELGIEPVMQGFYGIIPTSLKEKININTVSQGKWAGGFQRPDFLNPTDPQFGNIAHIYYSEIKKIYGDNFKFFGGDPFHEGGKTDELDIALSAQKIQMAMNKAFPKSTWVLQGWGGNPSNKLISKLNKEQTLIIELFGENTAEWEKRKGYENTPFIWCNVSNFGEKTGLYGKLQRFANEVHRAKESQYGHLMTGIGIIPEGIYNNPVTYDLTLELAWHNQKIDVNQWIKKYILYRYGTTSVNLEKAWEIFLKTVYSSPSKRQEGPSESIFCAKPSTSVKSVSTWGTRKRNYDMELFKEGVRIFIAEEHKLKDNQTYQTDKIDFLRQVISNQGELVYKELVTAIESKNIVNFEHQSKLFLDLILMQDQLLSRNEFFRLDYWLKKAENFGENLADKQQAIRNSKMQISIWGPDTNPSTDLNDYANKEWSGLLGTLYYQRWKKFVESEAKKLQNQAVSDVDYFEISLKWIDNPTPDIQPISDEAYKNIVNKILK